MRVLALVLGLVLGVLVLEEATVVGTLAGFAGTNEAAVVAGLGYAVAVLCFVGAALALPAPRGSTITFAVAGLVAVLVGAGTIWANMLVWGVAAFVLALCAHIGYRRRRRKAKRRAQAEIGSAG